jgi:AraC family transcriptional regulator
MAKGALSSPATADRQLLSAQDQLAEMRTAVALRGSRSIQGSRGRSDTMTTSHRTHSRSSHMETIEQHGANPTPPRMREPRINQFIRHPSRPLHSSAGLGWPGLYLEQHQFDPGGKPKGEIDGPLLCLWNNRTPTRCDHPDAKGRFVPKLVPPGAFSLYTAGPLAPVRLTSATSGLFVVLDEAVMAEVAQQLREEGNIYSIADGVVVQDKRCFLDNQMRQILEALSGEARNGSPNGRLYVDECLQRFYERFLLWWNSPDRSRWSRYVLDSRVFKRLQERLLSMPPRKLSLAALAADIGYSERHLFRSFRATIGRTPYQYVLDLRLENARRLMLDSRLNLLDIALECGFVGHAHFTKVFRQRFGISPSAFRKHL